MKKTIIRMLMTMLIGLSAIHSTAAEAPADSPAEASGPKAQMDALAKKAINDTVKVVAESGGFFPFGLVMEGEDRIRIVGIGEKPDPGTSKNDITITLFWQLRKLLQDNEQFFAAAIVKPHTVTSEEGKPVYGIWVTVDHRQHEPWVVFLPFIEQKNGTYTVSEEPVYLPAKEPLFLAGLKQESEE